LATLPVGTGSLTGATTNQQLGNVDPCQAPGPDNSYWWLTCPLDVGGAFSASTCEGTSFDTVLELQVPRTALSTCNNDYEPCGMRSSLTATIPPGAGLNMLTVDGATMRAFGSYQLSYTRP
jgi:hypothetical protein